MMTILEQLKQIDRKQFENDGDYYGLATLYEAVRLSPEDKEEIRKVLQATNDAEAVAAVLQTKAAATNEDLAEEVDDDVIDYEDDFVDADTLDEAYDTDVVAEILSGNIMQPKRGFKYLSSNGDSGEVLFNGGRYAFRRRGDGTFRVMRASSAGNNWSETLFAEDIDNPIQKKEVFHNDNGVDYDILERSKSGKNALLQRGNQWIIAWNCPENNQGSWGQGHYFFDEKTARKAWEEKYLNESAVANARTWLVDKEGKTPKEAEEIINNSSPEEIEKIALNYVKKNKEESLKEDAISDQHKFVYGALNLSDDKIKEIEKMFDTDYSSLSAEEQKYLVYKYDNLSQVNALLRFIQKGYKDAFSDGNDLAWKRFYNSVKRKVDEINKHNEEQIDVDAIIDYALEQRFDESLNEAYSKKGLKESKYTFDVENRFDKDCGNVFADIYHSICKGNSKKFREVFSDIYYYYNDNNTSYGHIYSDSTDKPHIRKAKDKLAKLVDEYETKYGLEFMDASYIVADWIDKCYDGYFNESLKEDWVHFSFKSGANPYIAKSQKEANRVIKKYGKHKVRKLKDGFYEIDDEDESDFFNSDLDEGIDVESTGKNRMPLYMAKDAIKKFNDDAKAYPYWVIKTSKWYDPEGLDITNKDYIIEYAGTYDECNNKLSQLINSIDNDWRCLDNSGKDFVTIYYPHAIAKATFSIIENPFLGELKEEKMTSYGHTEKDINRLKYRLREIEKDIENGADPDRFVYEKNRIQNELIELGCNDGWYDESLNEAYYEADFSSVPLVDKINFVNRKSNGMPGIVNEKELINVLNNVNKDKFKVRTNRFGTNISDADIKDSWMSLKRKGWNIGKAWDSSLKGFNEVYICEKTINESLKEDTIKQNGKWVNKGKEGTHGKFATKKAADAQRKAMFANGYKESLDKTLDDYIVANDDIQFDTAENIVDIFGEDSEYLQKLYDLGLDDMSGDFYIPEGTRLKFVGETTCEHDGSTMYQLQIDGDPNKEILVCDYTVADAIDDGTMVIDGSGGLEESLTEGLQDIHNDFEAARRQWDSYGFDVSLDDALEMYNEVYGDEDEHFYAKPIYDHQAWTTMVRLVSSKTDADVLEYDDDAYDSCGGLFDVPGPQEVANDMGRKVRHKDKIYAPQRNESLNESYSIVDLETGDQFGPYPTVERARAKALQYNQLFNAQVAVVDNSNHKVVNGYTVWGNEIKAKNEALTENVLNEDGYKSVIADLESIEKFLRDNDFYNYDVADYDVYPMETSKIDFEISGDWRHDHLKFKFLIDEWADRNNRKVLKIDSEEIGDSDSDDYTAIYHVYVAKDDEAYDKLNSMRGLFSESLDTNDKQIYINEIKEAEDIEDLEDIVHEIYSYDKGLFVQLRHFPKDKSFEEIRDHMIDVLQHPNTLGESLWTAEDAERLVDEDGYVDISRIDDYVWAKYDGDLDDLRDCARSIRNTEVYQEDGKVSTEVIREFAGAHNLDDRIYDESLKEDYQHQDDTWGTPYTYDEVEADLQQITNNWTDKDGLVRCYWEQEKEYGKQILQQHYEVVGVSDGRTGKGENMSWAISYAEPKQGLA